MVPFRPVIFLTTGKYPRSVLSCFWRRGNVLVPSRYSLATGKRSRLIRMQRENAPVLLCPHEKIADMSYVDWGGILVNETGTRIFARVGRGITLLLYFQPPFPSIAHVLHFTREGKRSRLS